MNEIIRIVKKIDSLAGNIDPADYPDAQHIRSACDDIITIIQKENQK